MPQVAFRGVLADDYQTGIYLAAIFMEKTGECDNGMVYTLEMKVLGYGDKNRIIRAKTPLIPHLRPPLLPLSVANFGDINRIENHLRPAGGFIELSQLIAYHLRNRQR